MSFQTTRVRSGTSDVVRFAAELNRQRAQMEATPGWIPPTATEQASLESGDSAIGMILPPTERELLARRFLEPAANGDPAYYSLFHAALEEWQAGSDKLEALLDAHDNLLGHAGALGNGWRKAVSAHLLAGAAVMRLAPPPPPPKADAEPPNATTKYRPIVEAMMLVCEHPELSDAEIARRVGVNKSTLSRSVKYQSAAAVARAGNISCGHVTIAADGNSQDVVAIVNTAPDAWVVGEPIPDSKLVKGRCSGCNEQIRIKPMDVGKTTLCHACE